jgi:tetratricopeptide (TPR) repeat protein
MSEAAPALRARYASIDSRLSAPEARADRDALKVEIAELYKQVDQQLAELVTLKEDVKRLVSRWKALQAPAGDGARPPTPAAADPLAPQFQAERPVVHADHLGASTFVEKAWSLISLGSHAEAEQALAKALRLAPDDPQAVSLLGWAQMLQEKYDEALLNFQKVLMREPANALARINVGYICLKKRIFGEAIEHLSKAIRLDNDRKATLYAHFYLGLVYLEREMFEDAQTFFRKTLAIGPNLIEAHYQLGRALWFGGEQVTALETWRAGHAANKFNPWGKRCGEMLAMVESGGSPQRPS